RAAAEDHAGGEDGETATQSGGVQGQGQAAVGEAGGGPAHEGGEAGGAVEGLVASGGVAVRAVQLAQPLPEGVERLGQGDGQVQGDAVEQSAAGQGDAEAGQGQPEAPPGRQIGKEAGNALVPLIQCLG